MIKHQATARNAHADSSATAISSKQLLREMELGASSKAQERARPGPPEAKR